MIRYCCLYIQVYQVFKFIYPGTYDQISGIWAKPGVVQKQSLPWQEVGRGAHWSAPYSTAKEKHVTKDTKIAISDGFSTVVLCLSGWFGMGWVGCLLSNSVLIRFFCKSGIANIAEAKQSVSVIKCEAKVRSQMVLESWILAANGYKSPLKPSPPTAHR